MSDDRDTVDMFPDLPRDPIKPPEDVLPPEVKATVKYLKKMARENVRPLEEQLYLKKAVQLLTDGWKP